MTDIKNLTDAEAVALTIWGEARSEGLEGMVAVGAVILNRVNDPQQRYGTGWKGVCLKKWQFSCWWTKDENGRAVEEMSGASETERIQNYSYALAKSIADGLLAAGRAQHYMTAALFEQAAPGWAKNQIPDTALGGHLFFEGIDT